MVHGDDSGIVVPPRVAPVQVVLVPVYTKTNVQEINKNCTEITKTLIDAGIRAEADLRDNYKPGWKYNFWELRGVPVRLELGARDLAQNTVVAARRDTKEKVNLSKTNIVSELKNLLIDIQQSLYNKAKKDKEEHTKSAITWEEFLAHLNEKNIVKVPFCCTASCEGKVKEKSAEESKSQTTDHKFELTGAAKSLCIPFEQPELPQGTKCFACGNAAVAWTLFGRSY